MFRINILKYTQHVYSRVNRFRPLIKVQRNVLNGSGTVAGYTATVPFLFGLLSLLRTEQTPVQKPLNEKELSEKERREAIKKADDLFNGNKHDDTCDLLQPYKKSGDVEVLWRLARAKYKLSCLPVLKNEEKRVLVHEAYDIICRALEIDDNNFAVHKWMSVLLDAKSALDGIKERIVQLEKVKSHLLEAVRLNPKDATTLYMLGSWCYQIADMPWYQRKIASTIFASPPVSSFEEALEFFKQAEEVQPNFYSQNLLMLGKTYLKLGLTDRAKYFLKLAMEYLVTSDDDLMAHQEADNLLQGLDYNG